MSSTHGASLAAAVQAVGAGRVEATLVEFLVTRGEGSTRQLLDATGLRQPEVSVGMRRLQDRGWVESRPAPNGGKGRPMNVYRLRIGLAEVASYYESRAVRRIERFRSAVDELHDALTVTL